MAKGPKGEKRSADVSGAVMPGGHIDPDEAEGTPGNAPNFAEVGGDARAKSTPTARRKEINKAAASPRWEG